jgi:hypothetical protein
MSFGVALSNAIAIGLGGIVTLFSGDSSGSTPSTSSLLCENGNNLVQEDGGLILLE